MSYLFILKDFRHGGVEKVFLNYSRSLKKDGFDLHYCILNNDYVSGENQIFLKEKSVIKNIIYIRSLIKIKKITHIVCAKEKSNLFAFFVSLFTSVKVIYCRHASLDSKEQKISFNVVKLLYLLYSLRVNSRFNAVSRAIAKNLNPLLNGHRVNVVPNPIFNDISDCCKFEDPCINNVRPYFLAAGRLVKLKGFDFLIKVYASAKKIDQNIPKLLIAGDGPERAALVLLIESFGLTTEIEIIEYPDEITTLMKASAAFIMTSRSEGMPTVLIEAIHSRCSIISTDCKTGPRELLQEYGCGRLIEVDNEKDLLDSILNFSAIIKPTMSAAKEITEKYSVKNSLSKLGVYK